MLVVEGIRTYGAYLSFKDFLKSRILTWVEFQPTSTEFHLDVQRDWSVMSQVQLVLRDNFVQQLLFHLSVKYSSFISLIFFVSRHTYFMWNLAQVITLSEEWINRYGIHHWRTFIRTSLRKLTWMSFEHTTNQFKSDALTDGAIGSLAQFPLMSDFV